MACEDVRGYTVRYIYVFDRYRRTNLAVVLGMLLQYEVVIDYLRAFLRPGAALCIGTIRSATPMRFRNGCAGDMVSPRFPRSVRGCGTHESSRLPSPPGCRSDGNGARPCDGTRILYSSVSRSPPVRLSVASYLVVFRSYPLLEEVDQGKCGAAKVRDLPEAAGSRCRI